MRAMRADGLRPNSLNGKPHAYRLSASAVIVALGLSRRSPASDMGAVSDRTEAPILARFIDPVEACRSRIMLGNLLWNGGEVPLASAVVKDTG